jgi:exodeoxyribonuclease VII small subunit
MADAPGEPSFDQILVRLREVVLRLESGELSLEQSLQIYEEGVALARRGQQLLATAEKRVEILVSASSSTSPGGIEVAPFDVSSGES